MKNALLFQFHVNRENNTIQVERSFNAPLDLVWTAWTDATILDQWWAPKPFKTVTKSMNFTEGGRWLYCMEGPQNEKHWSYFDYDSIHPQQFFSGIDGFCDEQGKSNEELPHVRWKNDFHAQEDSTMVEILLSFNSLEDLETTVKMGFQEGFTAGLNNLDHYIQTQFYLRQQLKPNNMSRVSTYLNFPGTTEDAFTFYRAVFKTDFVGGIRRFGDLPEDPALPPMEETMKKLVIHIELPIVGGHILMATDATKEMGFQLHHGNNMHINLEPNSREEAKRLFDELSAGGNVEMPIQDMFWGAYYGSFTDKFGINWMINYQPNR